MRTRGHRCTLINVPGAEHLIDGDDLAFEPIDGTSGPGLLDGHMRLLADPTGPSGLRRMIRSSAAMTAALLDGVPAVAARIGADAVLADMAEPAGPVLARHLRLPCVATVTGLPLMAEPGVPPPFVDWPYLSGGAGRFRNQGGHAVARWLMRPIDRVIEERAQAWGVAAAGGAGLQVAQCPAAFDFPRRRLPAGFRYGAPWRLPENEGADLPDDGRPLVFCSLGSLQGSRTAVFAAMTAACASVGARAVVAHGGGLSEAEAVALPGDPLVRDWWPQRAVLKRCSAAVLHGGFNTVIDALAAGVPIVAVPIAFEQPATAARIEWTGAGRMVPFRRATRATLARALGAVLGQSCYRKAARTLSVTIAGRNGASEAAEAITAWLAPSGAGDAMASPG